MSHPFEHPSTLLVTGPSQCGKTSFVLRAPFHPKPQKIFYFYGAWNQIFNKYKKRIEFIKDLPEDDFTVDPKFRNLIIIDDLYQEAKNNRFIGNLFTKGSHHNNLSVILISQNLFSDGRQYRTISLNCSYMILFKNLRDGNQIRTLGYQMYGKNSSFLTDVFKHATLKRYGYLIVCFLPNSNDNLRVYTNILPEEQPTLYYKHASKDKLSVVKKTSKKQSQKEAAEERDSF